MAGKRNERKWRARGGMSKDTVKFRVRERDGGRCTKCGISDDEHFAKYGKRTEVHRKTPGSLYTLKGCVLLCCTCHGPEPRRKPGTKDQENRTRDLQVSLGRSPFVHVRGRYAVAIRALATATGRTPHQVVLDALARSFEEEGV